MLYNHPKPDWTLADIEPGTRDIGWAEGTLPDGRPYFLEHWKEGGSELATFYFSPHQLDELPPTKLLELMLISRLIKLEEDPIPVDAGLVSDSLGQELLSLNLVLRDPTQLYAQLEVPTKPYEY